MGNFYQDLNGSEFKLLTLLIFNMDEYNQVSVSLRTLEQSTGLSLTTVIKVLQDLEDKGLVKKQNLQEAVSRQTPNSYHLLFDKRRIGIDAVSLLQFS